MSNFIVNTDIPNLRVVIREGDQYNINIVPGRITTQVTGSFTSYADMAGMAASASYVSGASVSAQFATSASYAETINRHITGSVVISDDLTVQGIISAEKLLVSSSVIYESGSTKFGDSPEDTHQFTGSLTVQGPISASSFTGSINLATVTENSYFEVPFISESKISTDGDTKLTFNPSTHQLRISGGLGTTAGNVRIDTTGVAISSGSTHTSGLNKDGVFTSMDGRQIGLVGWPSQVTSRPGFATHDNPAIFVTSGSTDYTAYIPMEFQGSGSYTDGRVTVNTPLVVKQGIQATGSVVAPDGFTGSLYGTASVADGIDVVIAGIYETGSASVIIPTPSGGYTYISTASYALTASYIANNTWGNLLNIPTGLLSSSVQVYPLPVESSSYALTASYAMNGGGGGGAGSSGTSGTSGANGASGTSGTSGIAGSSGSSGTAGSSGTSGQNGTSGTSGVSPSLPTGTVSSSAQIVAALPVGTVSSSLQISTGSFTGSFTGSLTGTITSASYAVTASYAQNATATVPAGTVSSSAQVIAALPTGTVSGSTQITNLGFVANAGTASFAITGSNIFSGNQTITGSLAVSSTASFNGPVSANDATLLLSNSSSLILTSGSSIYVAPSGSITGSVVATEMILPLAAPVTPQTGSMYFSGSFIFVYTGTQYRSASLA